MSKRFQLNFDRLEDRDLCSQVGPNVPVNTPIADSYLSGSSIVNYPPALVPLLLEPNPGLPLQGGVGSGVNGGGVAPGGGASW